MAKRSGANAEIKRAEKRDQISRVKPGRYIVIIGLVLTAAYFSVKALKKVDFVSKIAPIIEVEGIDIIGIKQLDSIALADAAGIDSGMTLLSADRKELLAMIRSFPGIASASLGFPFSKRVKVTVVEREPIAFTIIDGRLYFMAEDGVIWPFTSGSYWEIPVLTGVGDTLCDDGVHRITERDLSRFSGIVNSFGSEKWNRPVCFDLSNRDRITVRFNGLVPLVRFSNNPENRMENMRGIIQKLRNDDVEVRHYIDLSYNNVAFFR